MTRLWCLGGAAVVLTACALALLGATGAAANHEGGRTR